MSRLTQCFALCLGGLTAACTSEATGPTAPASPLAAVITPAALTAGPKLALSDSLIGFCYRPGTTRNCVFLSERVRITSTVRSLHWRAATDVPWLVLSATTGTTPAGLKISVDLDARPAAARRQGLGRGDRAVRRGVEQPAEDPRDAVLHSHSVLGPARAPQCDGCGLSPR